MYYEWYVYNNPWGVRSLYIMFKLEYMPIWVILLLFWFLSYSSVCSSYKKNNSIVIKCLEEVFLCVMEQLSTFSQINELEYPIILPAY